MKACSKSFVTKDGLKMTCKIIENANKSNYWLILINFLGANFLGTKVELNISLTNLQWLIMLISSTDSYFGY